MKKNKGVINKKVFEDQFTTLSQFSFGALLLSTLSLILLET